MSTAIVWFRRDLRLADNPALDAALQMHDRVLPIYINAPHEEAPWQPGGASRWWLHHALVSLDADLARRGAALHIRHGSSLQVLEELQRATDADAIYWNRLYDPATLVRDGQVKQALGDRGISVHSYNAALLCEPWKIATQQGEPYRVFTAYWRKLRSGLEPRPPIPAPLRIDAPKLPGGISIDALQLLPHVGWDTGMRAAWTPSESAAWKEVEQFIDDALSDYPEQRNLPAVAGTSRLSPYLHFGQISPMQLLWRFEDLARETRARRSPSHEAVEAYVRELGWRDFAHHLLYHFPHTVERSLNVQFDRFPWNRADSGVLKRWQRGQTGIPIVDAGMRELWNTGWMHNRVRMIVASFLTKNLRLHWRHGARWFWDTLVDADLPNNTQGWQWTAGSGADAAPYFRIFNPVSQGERFDPQGEYVRRWVPELAQLDAKWIHKPWENAALLDALDYPAPMVDLKTSREEALAAYQQMRARV